MNESDEIDYTDPEVLERLYWDEEKSLQEIADIVGVDYQTVWYHMDRHDIERRDCGPDKKYTDEELLEWIDRFVESSGTVPSSNHFIGGPGPSQTAYRARFGTVTKAIKEAGYTPRSEQDE